MNAPTSAPRSRSIVVVSAGLSQPSSTRLLADQLAAATQLALEPTPVTVTVIELRDHAQDIANNLLTGFPSPSLQAAIEAVTKADGIIVVSPIFNASYSGLFKSFIDILAPETLAGKSVLIGATGGTARHSLALEYAIRPLFAYLHAIVVPTAVFAATEDWGGSDRRGLSSRIDQAAAELADLVSIGAGRTTGQDSSDPYTNVIPFDQLLR